MGLFPLEVQKIVKEPSIIIKIDIEIIRVKIDFLYNLDSIKLYIIILTLTLIFHC